MNLVKDKFPIVCPLGKKEGDDFICPAFNEMTGTCSIYTNDTIKSLGRWGLCNYKEMRRPLPTVKKSRINPLKASKRAGA